MSNEFIKPNRLSVNITLQKDLCEGEELCPTCKGLGVVIMKNRYGLTEDPDQRIMFPYRKDSLVLCPTCYNGVVRRCKLCGKIVSRSRTKCDCDKQRELDRIEREHRLREVLSKAPEATSEILDNNEYFYSDEYGNNEGYFSDWDEFFEYWYEEHGSEDASDRPVWVWTTVPVHMKIDAATVAESATEELYEDAYGDISDAKFKELQDYLDKWCENCGVGTTYYQGDHKVRIPWEDYQS